ncbi:hypothetical protein BKA64DRAFT_709095 [Cadophora sp. MPI-SDFR-AT-0126]|nr:hypothetical protein BKA64DRAFT_709095 [Leotiomycetes sp. MPI-SDFR-AT-0126]
MSPNLRFSSDNTDACGGSDFSDRAGIGLGLNFDSGPGLGQSQSGSSRANSNSQNGADKCIDAPGIAKGNAGLLIEIGQENSIKVSGVDNLTSAGIMRAGGGRGVVIKDERRKK